MYIVYWIQAGTNYSLNQVCQTLEEARKAPYTRAYGPKENSIKIYRNINGDRTDVS